MAEYVTCPNCGSKMLTADTVLGRRIRCFGCDSRFLAAPDPAEPEPRPAPPPRPPPPPPPPSRPALPPAAAPASVRQRRGGGGRGLAVWPGLWPPGLGGRRGLPALRRGVRGRGAAAPPDSPRRRPARASRRRAAPGPAAGHA